VTGQGGFAAAGVSLFSRPIGETWTSADGVRWQRHGSTAFGENRVTVQLVAVGSELVALAKAAARAATASLVRGTPQTARRGPRAAEQCSACRSTVPAEAIRTAELDAYSPHSSAALGTDS
jgi:hypothetical protein